jgi:hypothetical protein
VNWLFSYQGSGSNYIRYCIEFLSKKPTQGPFRLIPHDQEFILMRSHYAFELSENEKIVILIRNPFELIFRENVLNNTEKELSNNMHTVCGRYQSFIENYPNAKIFFYEEVVNDFNKIKELIKYYEIILEEDINKFESNLEHHKINSYKFGNKFYSDKSELFYSKNLSSNDYNILYDIILSYPKNLVDFLKIYFR